MRVDPESRPWSDRLSPRASLIVSVFLSYRRKLRAPSLPGFIRPREQRRCRSQLQGCPFLRGHGRHDAQLGRRRPRRNRFAPLSENAPRVAARRPTMGPVGEGVKVVAALTLGVERVPGITKWRRRGSVCLRDLQSMTVRWQDHAGQGWPSVVPAIRRTIGGLRVRAMPAPRGRLHAQALPSVRARSGLCGRGDGVGRDVVRHQPGRRHAGVRDGLGQRPGRDRLDHGLELRLVDADHRVHTGRRLR